MKRLLQQRRKRAAPPPSSPFDTSGADGAGRAAKRAESIDAVAPDARSATARVLSLASLVEQRRARVVAHEVALATLLVEECDVATLVARLVMRLEAHQRLLELESAAARFA